jgi:hypothetical protein
LPTGLRGLILASLMAAFMSTLSTHLNWGSSYVVNDFYKRFVRPDAPEKELVLAGRITTMLTMIVATLVGLWLSNALQAFQILLQIGAGTGLLFILRWFWWRINAYSEIAAMVVSFAVALGFEVYAPASMAAWEKLVTGVAITTAVWLAVTFLTRPTEEATLRRFCALIRPGGPGWKRVYGDCPDFRGARRENGTVPFRRVENGTVPLRPNEQPWNVPMELVCTAIGCVVVYGALLASGYWLYGNYVPASILTVLAAGGCVLLFATWTRVRGGEPT